jgi:hypothetical protein
VTPRCIAAALAAWLAACPPAAAQDWLAECKIRFDNEFALTWVYAQARGTFAQHTGLSSGTAQPCTPADSACWTYRERCGSRGYVNVEEAPIGKYNHFHLLFEDASLTCFADPGDGLGAGFGRGDFSDCTAADWKREPRMGAGHDEGHFMRVWVEDRVTHEPRTFDIASIRVRGPAPAQIWFQKGDGSWWFWSSLSPRRWDLRSYTTDIRGLYLRAAEGAGTSVTFDDVVVRN